MIGSIQFKQLEEEKKFKKPIRNTWDSDQHRFLTISQRDSLEIKFQSKHQSHMGTNFFIFSYRIMILFLKYYFTFELNIIGTLFLLLGIQ